MSDDVLRTDEAFPHFLFLLQYELLYGREYDIIQLLYSLAPDNHACLRPCLGSSSTELLKIFT